MILKEGIPALIATALLVLLETARSFEPGADAKNLDRALDPLVDCRGRHVEPRRDFLRIVMRQHQPQTGTLGFGQLLDASCGHAAMVARTRRRCTIHVRQDRVSKPRRRNALKVRESLDGRLAGLARSPANDRQLGAPRMFSTEAHVGETHRPPADTGGEVGAVERRFERYREISGHAGRPLIPAGDQGIFELGLGATESHIEDVIDFGAAAGGIDADCGRAWMVISITWTDKGPGIAPRPFALVVLVGTEDRQSRRVRRTGLVAMPPARRPF
nr:hypothetical protein [Sphingomonas sp. Leaf34]